MTDVSDFIVTSDANTSKYLTNTPYTNSFTSSSVIVGVGAYTTRTYDVPLSQSTRVYSVWVNLSLDGSLYAKMPNSSRLYGSQLIETRMNASSNVATIILYLINTGGVPETFPTFTINVIRRDFLDET